MSKKKRGKRNRRKWQPTKLDTDDARQLSETPSNRLSTPIVSASRKRMRNIVEFVYPKENGERKPFVFDKQQQQQATFDSSMPAAAKHTTKKTPTRTDETIDDILSNTNGKKKKRRKNSDVESSHAVVEMSGLSGRGHDDKDDDDDALHATRLSGRSVEDAVRDKLGCRPRANSTDGELQLPSRGLCDERVVLESYRWRKHNVHGLPRGFINLGNTCFLNATLQCLAHLPTFSQTLMSLPSHTVRNGTKPTKGQRMTSMLSALFRQVHGMDANSMSSGGGAISPRAIVHAVPTLGSGGSRSGYNFRPGRQEDAHEFLVHLLDAMQDGELRAAGINQHQSGWRDRLPIPRLDETTFINRIFGGYLRSQVKCTRCGYRSNTYDPCLDLSLEVSKKSLHSVSSAFSEFTRMETLDARNRWKCSGCKKHVCAMKQLTVFRPPLSLCIQLKRFTYGGGGFGSFGGFGFVHYSGKGIMGGGGGGSKISKRIEFPSTLKLPLSDGRHCEYNLTGVVVHVGPSASSGHYTAFVKKPGTNGGKDQWYHMDDSYVERVSEATVLMEKDAYVLFYSRKEVKIEYPSPPPRQYESANAAREGGAVRARARASSIDDSFLAAADDKKSTSSRKEIAPSLTLVGASDANDLSNGLAPSGTSTSEQLPLLSSNVSNQSSTNEGDSDSSSSDDESSSSESSSSSSDSDGSGGDEHADDDRSKKIKISVEAAGDQNGEENGIANASRESSSETSESESDDDAKPNATVKEAKVKPKPDRKTRVVTSQDGTQGKLAVMLGPRRGSKAWKPKAISSTARDSKTELLGSAKVDKWGDDDEDDDSELSNAHSRRQSEQRTSALKQLGMQERSRKRKMYVDRWDAMLDEGKKKKVKEKHETAPMAIVEPAKNPFHRIQSGMQRMNRGKPKRFRRGNNGKPFPFRGNRKKKKR